jgi:hypothetical protein
MAGLFLSARENHKEISIVCPRCKFGSKYSVSYVEDAIHDKLVMTCCVCERKFQIVTISLEVTQSNTACTGLAETSCPECGVPQIVEHRQSCSHYEPASQ